MLEAAGLLQLVGRHRAGSHCQTFTLTRHRPGLSDANNVLPLPCADLGGGQAGEGLRLHMTRKSDPKVEGDDMTDNPKSSTSKARTRQRTATRPTPDTPASQSKLAGVPFAEAAEASRGKVDRILESLPIAQRERVVAIVARAQSRSRDNDMKLRIENGTLAITYSHDDPDIAALMMMADLGTMDPAFYSGLTAQIARIGAHGATVDETNSNFLLSVVRAVEPRDELESMLAIQMGAVHAATMMMARRLNHVVSLPQQDAAERALNKLARTYAVQMEALKRYRTGGQQRVIVEHVTVNAGGQAIVGAVAAGGRGNDER